MVGVCVCMCVCVSACCVCPTAVWMIIQQHLTQTQDTHTREGAKMTILPNHFIILRQTAMLS